MCPFLGRLPENQLAHEDVGHAADPVIKPSEPLSLAVAQIEVEMLGPSIID